MTVRPSPIREALGAYRSALLCGEPNSLRMQGAHDAALAELDALEAVADAAREVCITYHPRSCCPSCGMGESGTWDTHFDRSLCACGSMHTYCNECGKPVDGCELDAGDCGEDCV